MTTPDELQRAVKALTDMRDAARDGTPVTDPNEWEFNELTRILTAFHFLLSERAELLATVERMRGALDEAANSFARIKDYVGGRNIDFASAFARADHGEKRARDALRAALTTGEATTPNAGERG
jgi:hypothetical protein